MCFNKKNHNFKMKVCKTETIGVRDVIIQNNSCHYEKLFYFYLSTENAEKAPPVINLIQFILSKTNYIMMKSFPKYKKNALNAVDMEHIDFIAHETHLTDPKNQHEVHLLENVSKNVKKRGIVFCLVEDFKNYKDTKSHIIYIGDKTELEKTGIDKKDVDKLYICKEFELFKVIRKIMLSWVLSSFFSRDQLGSHQLNDEGSSSDKEENEEEDN